MATSSFDRNVIINKENYESLEKIIEDKSSVNVDFKSMRKIELVTKENIKLFFK